MSWSGAGSLINLLAIDRLSGKMLIHYSCDIIRTELPLQQFVNAWFGFQNT